MDKCKRSLKDTAIPPTQKKKRKHRKSLEHIWAQGDCQLSSLRLSDLFAAFYFSSQLVDSFVSPHPRKLSEWGRKEEAFEGGKVLVCCLLMPSRWGLETYENFWWFQSSTNTVLAFSFQRLWQEVLLILRGGGINMSYNSWKASSSPSNGIMDYAYTSAHLLHSTGLSGQWHFRTSGEKNSPMHSKKLFFIPYIVSLHSVILDGIRRTRVHSVKKFCLWRQAKSLELFLKIRTEKFLTTELLFLLWSCSSTHWDDEMVTSSHQIRKKSHVGLAIKVTGCRGKITKFHDKKSPDLVTKSTKFQCCQHCQRFAMASTPSPLLCVELKGEITFFFQLVMRFFAA